MEGSVCESEIGGGLARTPCRKAMFGFFDHMIGLAHAGYYDVSLDGVSVIAFQAQSLFT